MKLIEIVNAGVISEAPTFSQIGMNILSFLLYLLPVVAIIMIVISGIKYFLSFDDKNRLDEAKKTFRYSVVGILAALSALVIIKFIGQFIK